MALQKFLADIAAFVSVRESPVANEKDQASHHDVQQTGQGLPEQQVAVETDLRLRQFPLLVSAVEKKELEGALLFRDIHDHAFFGQALNDASLIRVQPDTRKESPEDEPGKKTQPLR
jgi:hypothetical protein